MILKNTMKKLTQFLDQLAQTVPALELAVSCRENTVFRYRAGWQDKEKQIPLGQNALFRGYSVCKPITAAAALTLYEAGAFSMDDPVSRFLPAYENLTVLQPDGTVRSAHSTMTIGQLFTMTSGIRYGLALPAIENAVAQTKGLAPTVAVAQAIASAPLAFAPGTDFCYSLSSDVLAAVTEVIAGCPFRDFVKERIFTPCGMENSKFHLEEGDLSRLVCQYRYDKATQTAVPMEQRNEFVFGSEYDSGGAGIIATAEDMLRFCRMLARQGIADNGERILQKTTIDLMRSNHLSPAALQTFGQLGIEGYGYGLGVRTLLKQSGPVPAGEFGWFGASGAYMLADPKHQIAVYYAQQVRAFPTVKLHKELRDLIYEALDSSGLL